MESILTKKLIIPHLTNENLLSNKQYGFISERSTTTQLLHYLDRCAKIIAEGDSVDVIYFDFAKAFDTVSWRNLKKNNHFHFLKTTISKEGV